MPALKLHEPLVHDRGAAGEVRTQPHPVGIRDAHAARHDVVGHPRELVDAEHLDGAARQHPHPGQLEALDRARALRGPHDVGEHAEQAVERDRVGHARAGARAGAAAASRRRRRRAGRRGRRSRGAPRGCTPRASSRPARASSPSGAASSPAPPGSPSAGDGNHASRTVPSSVRVSRAWPQAVRVMPTSVEGGARSLRWPVCRRRPPPSTSPPTSPRSPPRCATSSR